MLHDVRHHNCEAKVQNIIAKYKDYYGSKLVSQIGTYMCKMNNKSCKILIMVCMYKLIQHNCIQ